jgi:hypothetical protein
MLGIEYSPCYHCDKTKCSFCELTRYKDSQQKKEASEMRLIDADAVKDSFCGVCSIKKRYGESSEMCRDYKDLLGNGCSVMRLIEAAPTVDAVEVVRCKDCKHYGTSGCAMDAFSFDVTEESFCSYGERRENEQT